MFGFNKKEFSILSLPVPGPCALKAAEDAQSKAVLSVREVGHNAGQSVLTYLKSVFLGAGNPWCLAFAMYRLTNAAHELGISIPADFPRTGYTPTSASWFKTKGLWIKVSDVSAGRAAPMVGDWAFFYFPSEGRIGHVGIVVKVTMTGVWTVEGNTGPDKNSGVQREGDGVYLKFRDWRELGAFGGFGRLPY